MTFSKPFNPDERAYIIRNHGYLTAGDIARELNRWYKSYNEAKRTPDGVRRYIAEMNGARVEVELPREVVDQLKVAGHDVEQVQAEATMAARAVVNPLLSKAHRSKAKS